ncbi:DUF5710 domain-containing protein [Escherichia coli]|uniref:DUF5710 domain-containing protein n=1 Tax=Escherichia coli TaxID=562 RepID=UPI000D15F54C|nr:DUF5710 domain-containing protein [Escherichia coli]PSY62727.1 DNA primase [Escherichia coli]
MARIDINVPYNEKDEAKRLGARWDATRKTWYIPDGVPTSDFTRWLPSGNVLSPYWFIAQTPDQCWKCGRETVMTSFLLPAGHKTLEQDEDGLLYWQMQELPAFIFYVDDIPEQNLKKLEQIRHYLAKDYSKTVNARYWMNHCQHCHMKQGDFQLHCEVDSAFSPDSREVASRIVLYRIEQEFSASCSGTSLSHLHFRCGAEESFATAGEWLPFMKII